MIDLTPYHNKINQLKSIDHKLYARAYLRYRVGNAFKPIPNRNLSVAEAKGIEQWIDKLLPDFSSTNCPKCGGTGIFDDHVDTDYGIDSASSYQCEQCQTWFLVRN